MVYDLSEKLRSARIFLETEVERFAEVFYQKSKASAAIGNVCKPAVERWTKRYNSAVEAYKTALAMYERTKKTGDAVLIGNAETSLKDCKTEKDGLELFKKDLGTFVRYYEFLSQIVPYDDRDLEKLSLYARHLRPLLREAQIDEDEIDLSSVMLKHYRLSKIREKDIKLKEDEEEFLQPGDGAGSAKPNDPQAEFLSEIIARLNEVFNDGEWTENDKVNYLHTVADKLSENAAIMDQMRNNSREQAMLGDFQNALDDAIFDSGEVHSAFMTQLLSDPGKAKAFGRLVFEMLWEGRSAKT